jgi:hypothetical protein
MIFKIRQGLTFQQNPKHPIHVRRFLHGDQVLNLTEGYHPLDPILWVSILEDSKLSIWDVWIHEKHQLDPFRLVRIIPINLIHLLHLGNKRKGRFSRSEGGKAAADLENLLMSIVWIEIMQQKFRSVITVLYVERTIAIYGCNLF